MRFAAGVLLCVVTAACQPQQQASLSVEQAKQITAEFKGQSFVPPPRTIADITAVLDQYRPDPAKVAAAKARADEQPEPGLSDNVLARFYYRRGIAAGEIGRLSQELADLRRAVELGGSGTGTNTSVMLQQLGRAELGYGNPVNAIRYGEQQNALDDQADLNYRARLFTGYVNLVHANIARGNLEEAARWVDRLRALDAESGGWYDRSGQLVLVRPIFRAKVADGEASLALAKGLYRKAETSRRTQIEQQEQGLRNYSSFVLDKPPLIYVENARDEAIVGVASALREQGKLVEAEIEARRALTNTLKYVGRYHNWTAERLNALTSIILEEGRAADGERLARASIDILETVDADTSWTLASARQMLGSALAAQGRWSDALASFDAIRAGLADDPLGLTKWGSGTLDWVTALVKVGQPQLAVEMATRLLERERSFFGDAHYKTAEARAYLAMALAAQGNRELALQRFRDALPVVLTGAPQSAEDAETGKAQRLRLLLDAYIRLLAAIRNTPLEAQAGVDAATEAFRLADAARGQAVQRALAAASARLSVRDPVLADLARREQDAATQLTALEGVLTNALSTSADQQDSGGIQTLRGQIDQLRQARTALVREIEQRFPDYAQLINPQPATVERARQALRPGEALVATYVSDHATFVWTVPQQGQVAFTRASLSAVELGEMVMQLRRALDPRPQSLGDIPAFDVALANRLYQQLLEPVEPAWRDASSLLVVTDGALAQLPLGVLVTDPKPAPAEARGQALFAGYKQVLWLVRRVAITQLPSVAALASLRALPAAAGERKPFIGFGDPWFSPEQATQVADLGAGETATRGGQRIRFRSAPATATLDSADLAKLPRLPDTADEVRDIARALKADPDKDVFVGPAANEHTVETMNLSDRRVIAFATHGLVPGDLNGLTEPALALSAPQVAHVEGDGLLTMDEVLGLKLNADWVVLSACNTAAGDGAGAEAVSGLGRAFFYAGARALLVSNWPVETTSARALTTDVFRRQADNPALSRAEALRQAELALIDGGGLIDPATQKVAFSYAHPIFWAPFSLVGDGGGSGVR